MRDSQEYVEGKSEFRILLEQAIRDFLYDDDDPTEPHVGEELPYDMDPYALDDSGW